MIWHEDVLAGILATITPALLALDISPALQPDGIHSDWVGMPYRGPLPAVIATEGNGHLEPSVLTATGYGSNGKFTTYHIVVLLPLASDSGLTLAEQNKNRRRIIKAIVQALIDDTTLAGTVMSVQSIDDTADLQGNMMAYQGDAYVVGQITITVDPTFQYPSSS